MKVLILKLNATGDVVRTTALLRVFQGDVTWITDKRNIELLARSESRIRCLEWEQRELARDSHYDLVINLEDEEETAGFVREVDHSQRFGAYMNGNGSVTYTADSHRWFDMSLISAHGREQADALKLKNRATYQELIFEGLGMQFSGQRYLLPAATVSPDFAGDVAIAPVAGPVWPMKGWAYYDALKARLEEAGLRVNVLPRRSTLLEHMGDVKNHRCLVGGDSLPMHLAIGTDTPSVTLFNCTSPWEIHDYGLQTKVISPLLETFFYRRGLDPIATAAISLEVVYDAVMHRLSGTAHQKVQTS